MRPQRRQPTRLLCPWDSPGWILEWVAKPSSRGLSQPRDWTHISYISCIAGGFFTTNTTCCCCCQVTSVVFDSMPPFRWQPTRLPRPWDSPGKNTGVGCHFLLQCMKVKSESEVAQSCPTLSNPMDCSLPGFSIHGILQARVLEWGAIAFSGNGDDELLNAKQFHIKIH